jgi:hypothetical protein
LRHRRSFDDATFSAVASSTTPTINIVTQLSRRLALLAKAASTRRSREALAEAPAITVPTITLEGDANGAPHPEPSAYARKFSGKYAHRTVSGGVGHNLPQKRRRFAEAIVEVDSY